MKTDDDEKDEEAAMNHKLETATASISITLVPK
jgi:hypothetical protein